MERCSLKRKSTIFTEASAFPGDAMAERMKGINDGQFNILPLGGATHRLLSPRILLSSRMRADRVTQRSVLFRA